MMVERYLTLIFFPFLMLLPFRPLSFLSFLTVVLLRAAISDNVSPPLTVTDLLDERLLRLLCDDLRLLRLLLLLL
jgi:hypothetical protein